MLAGVLFGILTVKPQLGLLLPVILLLERLARQCGFATARDTVKRPSPRPAAAGASGGKEVAETGRASGNPALQGEDALLYEPREIASGSGSSRPGAMSDKGVGVLGA